MGRIRVLAVLAVTGIALLAATSAQAVILTNFNTTVATTPGNATVTQWTVDGTNQYLGGTGSWFYRVGAGPLINLDTVFSSATPVTGPNPGNPFDFSPTTVTSTYVDVNNGLQFTLKRSEEHTSELQ